MKRKIIAKNKAISQKIAKERIKLLFFEAEKSFSEHPKRAKRYVEMARKIGMKHNVIIPADLKKRFCKECGEFLVPGNNCTVRLDSKKNNVVFTCKNCKTVKRYPYNKNKKQK